ncbi:MAG TPA: SUMF1/EgtB/PvdO family nonheme iron enzyme, partial [Armatimonadota bacterium]|nr:SUMF1/EgtB/PvdO family nonheme iron enzyme [Armatimonadota bacterium]
LPLELDKRPGDVRRWWEAAMAPASLRDRLLASMEWVTIPAGAFLYGEEKERRYLETYRIMKYPVTVAQYRLFCKATGRAMPDPPEWGWIDDHPMVNVSWHDAAAFAKWAGLALPTEEEWEKAARGTDGRLYPWGNDWDAAKCHCSKKDWGDAKQTAPVGSYPAGASPYGVLDMAGNVWEWCNSWYDDRKSGRVLRGGSWYNDFFENNCRGAIRNDFYPDDNWYNGGFRCVALSPGP